MNNKTVRYREGYDFGMGVKSSTGDRMQRGVVGASTEIEGASGGSGGFQMESIQTTTDLETHMGISAEASGGVGVFSASARANFAQSSNVHTSSITLLLWCTRQYGFRQIVEPTLSPEAAELVAQGRADLFTDRFGDCFVVGLQTGGQFFGVLTIETRNEEQRKSFEGKMSGSYGPFSADVEVKMTEALKTTSSNAYARYWYEGGETDDTPVTPQELFKAAHEWYAALSTQRYPYAALLMPYVIANGPEPPNKVDLQHQQDVLVRCAKLRSVTIDKRNLVEYMTNPKHRDEFVADPKGPDLAKLMAGLSLDLEIIADAASFAIDNPRDALEPESFARAKRGLSDYALTLLPPNMPTHTGVYLVKVPDFRTARSPSEANKMAAESGLKLHFADILKSEKTNWLGFATDWHIDRSDPPAGSDASPGQTVTVVCTSLKGFRPDLNATRLGHQFLGK